MKLSNFLGEYKVELQKRERLDSLANFFDFMKKSTGDTGEAPTIGLDMLVNSWIREQFAFRSQLLEDLSTISRTAQSRSYVL